MEKSSNIQQVQSLITNFPFSLAKFFSYTKFKKFNMSLDDEKLQGNIEMIDQEIESL